MAMIASKAPGVRVTVCDINPVRIAAWNSDKLPIFEPGLDEVVKGCRGRNLFFSSDPEAAIADSDVIFISVNTPTKTRGLGAGMAADLTYWESAARMISKVSKTDKIIVEKSTVPVKTARARKTKPRKRKRPTNPPSGAAKRAKLAITTPARAKRAPGPGRPR